MLEFNNVQYKYIFKEVIMSKWIAGLLVAAGLFLISGCTSTQPVPEDILYTEFSFNECNFSHKYIPLVRRGYRGIIISDAKLKNTKGNNIVMGDLIINADNYMNDTPGLKERIEEDRIYKVYLYGVVSGNFLFGHEISPQLMKIEGLRTFEEDPKKRSSLKKQKLNKKAKYYLKTMCIME